MDRPSINVQGVTAELSRRFHCRRMRRVDTRLNDEIGIVSIKRPLRIQLSPTRKGSMIPKSLSVVHMDENATFPRFVIEDQEGRVWNGEEFVADRSKGELYAETEDACVKLQEILKRDLSERVLIRFTAPVVIEVYADPDAIVNPLEIAAWLSKTCRLQMNTSENGLGPDNSVVLPAIYFHRIEVCHEEP